MQNLLISPGVAHIGYIVKDRETAMARFSKLYDIKDWFLVEFKPSRAIYKGKEIPDYYLRIAISLPAEGTRIELLEPVSEGLHMDVLRAGAQTINHICHVVQDYDETVRNFTAAGDVMVLDTEYADTERGYRRCCYVYDDALNTVVELAEIPYFRPGDPKSGKPPRASAPAPSSLLQEIPIRHAGYCVKDREAAVRRLDAIYGKLDWTFIEYKPMRAQCFGKPVEHYHVRAAALPPSEKCGLEIIQPVSDGMHMEFFKRDSNGINHICHTVKDYESYRDRFIGMGCELIFEAEMEDEIRGYRRCGYAYDPVLKTIFELAEKPYFRK